MCVCVRERVLIVGVSVDGNMDLCVCVAVLYYSA